MVNCTVTPMDTAYAELAVNVPVSIPGGCSVPDTESCSVPGAQGSVELQSTSGNNLIY